MTPPSPNSDGASLHDPKFKSAKFKRNLQARRVWVGLIAPFHAVLARWRRPLAGKLIGITGSVGKTTATTLLDQLLKPYGSVTAGIEGNTRYQSLRTIRKLRRPVDFVVQEISGMPAGTIEHVTGTVPFDGAIITTVGNDHVAEFLNEDAVAAEKGKLAAAIPASGFVCLNADDPRVAAMAARTRARVITYGTAETATLRATDIRAAWPDGLRFTLNLDGVAQPVVTRLQSSIYLPSVLGALAAVHGLRLDLAPAIAALATAHGHADRFEIRRPPGSHSYLLDTVKASHWSTVQLFARLDELEVPGLVVVLGQVSDFKNDSSRHYRKMIRELAQRGYRVIGVGPASGAAHKIAAEGFANVLGLGRREDVVAHLATLDPTLVLLKGGDVFNLNIIADADKGRP